MEGAEQALIDAHHGTGVVEFAAVVGCAEKRNELSLREELVAVLDNLMGAANEVHIVLLQKARDDIRSEGERDTSIVFAPSSDIFVGVRPEEVAEESAVGDLSKSACWNSRNQQNWESKAG